jgi:hypothetical protein
MMSQTNLTLLICDGDDDDDDDDKSSTEPKRGNVYEVHHRVNKRMPALHETNALVSTIATE